MSTTRLILSEIRFRWLNFLLCLAAVIIAATLFITGPTLLGGYAVDTQRELAALQAEADRMQVDMEREMAGLQAEADRLQADMEQKKRETEAILADMDKQTKRIMRDLGVNLRIVHRDTNLGNLYTDFVAVDFPEEYIQKLAGAEQIETIVHLIATLQQKIKWRERTALVVGALPVTSKAQSSEGKQHMGVVVPPGTVYVGHELGVGLKEGETIEIEGQPFKIAQIMPEFGGLNDVQLVLDLHDAQKVLNKPGKINQIMALGCKCKGDRLSVIRKQLEEVLPDTRITEDKPRAEAREKQRDLVEATRKQEEERVAASLAQVVANRQRQQERAAASLAQVVANRQRQEASRTRQQQMLGRLINMTTPLVILTSALFVGLMTLSNVRERRPEIGVLRALGKSTGNIAALFLGKALFLGLLGGLLGCVLGYVLAPLIGRTMLDLAADLFRVRPVWLVATVLGAPLITVLASFLPTRTAVAQDPAIVLMDT